MLRLIGRRAALATTLAAGASARQAAALGGLALHDAPRPLPEFSFTDADGAARRVADFAGEALVINLWATWCAPCVAEMPSLDRAQEALASERVRVLALSSDRGGRAQVEPFYRERGIRHLAIWLDPRGAAARALGARGLPTTVIVDRAGLERARLEGATEWDAPPMLAELRRLLASGAAKPHGSASQGDISKI